jgi:hypothetical protein
VPNPPPRGVVARRGRELGRRTPPTFPLASVSNTAVETNKVSPVKGREGMVTPTLQTLQEPILLTPWVYFRGHGFPNPGLPNRVWGVYNR